LGRNALPALACLISLALGACASTAAGGDAETLVADPFEPVNRAMFAVNDGLDRAVIGPLADAYLETPQDARRSIRNAVDNVRTPLWMVNQALQGDIDGAAEALMRFAVNSTFGVAGLFDLAADSGLEKQQEDFGQTLAVYGVGQGPYLVLPLLGPSTSRRLAGRFVDGAINPMSWTRFDGDESVRTGVNVIDSLDARARAERAIETIREAPDPYVTARSLYIQARQGRLREDLDDPYADLPELE